jgi:hypothetical protein
MSEEKPQRHEFWKIIGTKKITDDVDARIQVPTFGVWKEMKAGEMVKKAFVDELLKISRTTKLVPSSGPKKQSPEEAFYAARRQPKASQRRAEQKAVQERKKKFGRLLL